VRPLAPWPMATLMVSPAYHFGSLGLARFFHARLGTREATSWGRSTPDSSVRPYFTAVAWISSTSSRIPSS